MCFSTVYISCVYSSVHMHFAQTSMKFFVGIPLPQQKQNKNILFISIQTGFVANFYLLRWCGKYEKKQHNEGNMALRIISILTH
jgi:Na+/melibiose symporter-like transporter